LLCQSVIKNAKNDNNFANDFKMMKKLIEDIDGGVLTKLYSMSQKPNNWLLVKLA
jgi:hypothetical protein